MCSPSYSLSVVSQESAGNLHLTQFVAPLSACEWFLVPKFVLNGLGQSWYKLGCFQQGISW